MASRYQMNDKEAMSQLLHSKQQNDGSHTFTFTFTFWWRIGIFICICRKWYCQSSIFPVFITPQLGKYRFHPISLKLPNCDRTTRIHSYLDRLSTFRVTNALERSPIIELSYLYRGLHLNWSTIAHIPVVQLLENSFSLGTKVTTCCDEKIQTG